MKILAPKKLATAAVLLLVLTLSAVIAWRSHGDRPSNVPATAVLVDGKYIDCIVDASPRSEQPCKVYEGSTGKLLETNPFAVRLKAFSTRHGGVLVDCGTTPMGTADPRVAECAKTAFQNRRPFTARYLTQFAFFTYAYGLSGDAEGNVAMANYDSRGFPKVSPTRRTELLDGNRVRLSPCIAPVTLGMTDDGLIACITPVNEKLSASDLEKKAIDTTICAIVENPAAYNNKLVRIRGHYSGNFEYSMLSGDGCSGTIWFEYGSDDSPPGLVAHVPGGATPGAEDEDGRRILPIPVSLVRNHNFVKLQRLMENRVKADKSSSRMNSDKFVSHQVTATFVGRVDGVSTEIHQFHLKRSIDDRADFLGFGQMGLFDAQFVMQSVENDAVLELERPPS